MSRKVYVDLKVRIIFNVDEGVEISEVIDDMEYNFMTDNNKGCSIEDTEITDYEVIDSK